MRYSKAEASFLIELAALVVSGWAES